MSGPENINTYKIANKDVERLLKDIHRVLIRMEERLNIIEKSVKKDDTKKPKPKLPEFPRNCFGNIFKKLILKKK